MIVACDNNGPHKGEDIITVLPSHLWTVDHLLSGLRGDYLSFLKSLDFLPDGPNSFPLAGKCRCVALMQV